MSMGNINRYGARRTLRKAAIGVLTGIAVFSGASVTAIAETIRVVALGDSLTQGFGLPAEHGFTAQLQAWVDRNSQDDVVIINAGVSGDTTAGGLARLEWSLAEGGDALIVELGGNDLLRAIDPAASRENLDGILAKAQARGIPVLLTGMRAPTNYGVDYKTDFDRMYPELAQSYGAIFDPFFLEGLIGQPDLFQPDGIHPNRAGVTRLVERFGPYVLRLVEKVKTD